ncbi:MULTISPECIES: peptidoglycan-binding domain-containing protein [Leisingera]|jgi:peptidoglycan hydrolase-like protein with peptidoglycan-binding domain|uniref:peptidoglycan-binding domain-containing protein n=1 Tax=Leisingera TaxID=191028 RepID=UPI00114E9B8D|nr:MULTISPECIES: peptidoglycan-binding domain-containing protein [Leisingera]QDI75081.1 peptidoglycan-binding protein [Leisingera aquaemixtae]
MFTKPLKPALAAAFLATSATGPAIADELGAAIVGGVIGGVIVNEIHKNKQRQRSTARTYRRAPAYSAARTENRETQTALNYFGFNAGSADGVLGRRSRAAISQYQIHMGYPATGHLAPYERNFLVSSYNRAQIGGPQVIKAMQGPQGVRGLLHGWRDEAAGLRTAGSSYGGNTYGGLPPEVSHAVDEVAASSEPSGEQLLQRTGFMQLADLNGDGRNDYVLDTSVSGSSFWCGASNCSVMVFASTPQGYQRNDFLARGVTPASFACHQGTCRILDAGTEAPVQAAQETRSTVTAAAAQPSVPLGGITLFDQPKESASLTSYCSKVSLLTSSNGGFMTADSMTDPELALGEQFCLARTYAINAGETQAGKVKGVTQAQIDSQCDAFGPAVQPFLAKLGTAGSGEVMGDVQKFVLQSGMSLEQLANTAGICLFSGYRRDDMEVALGAALILTGIGKRPYAELIGHHLALGFGAPNAAEKAQEWYSMAVISLEDGTAPVFAPGQPGRPELIKAASAKLAGGRVQPVQASSGAAALPSFSSD